MAIRNGIKAGSDAKIWVIQDTKDFMDILLPIYAIEDIEGKLFFLLCRQGVIARSPVS